jgi:hypothetical protein
VRCSNGSLLASHDTFGPALSHATRTAFTRRSDDNGKTWVLGGAVPNMYWATLFTRPGDAATYIMGTSNDNAIPGSPAQMVLAATSDCGGTWTASVFLTNSSVAYSTGPTPVVLKDGRLWRGFEHNLGSWGTGYAVVAASADAKATNLLDPAAWTVSGGLLWANVSQYVPPSWGNPNVTSSYGWLEGNAVLPANASQPGIMMVLRVNSIPAANKAALLRLDGPTATPAFLGWIDPFPGGMSKFTIRQDAVTGLFVTLSNNIEDDAVTAPPLCAPGPASWGAPIAPPDRPLGCCSVDTARNCGSTIGCWWCHSMARNNLTLSVSTNLTHWTVVATVMADDTGFAQWQSQLNTGFQYVDWQFDGDDLIAVVRAGYRGAECYHNSNRELFQRLVGWRSWPSVARIAAAAQRRAA